MKISIAMAFLTLLLASTLFLGVAGADVSAQHRGYVNTGRPEERRLATNPEWCVAKPNLVNAAYQGALDWVCGPLPGQGQVNCGPITSGQSCFQPNNYQAHASWAFNEYFQTHGQTSQACDFQGTAIITTTDPSTSTCPYPASNATSGNGNGTNGAVGSLMTYSRSLSSLFAIASIVTYLLTTEAL